MVRPARRNRGRAVTSLFLISLEIFFRASFRLALLVIVASIARTVFQWWRAKTRAPSATARDFHAWPFVTVQLPMYNERYVAERVIRSAAALDYPRDRLEIQVLDDSYDETTILADAAVAEARARTG